MKKIRVSFDPIGYTSKPSKTDIKKINNRIAQCIKEINTPKEMKTFAEMVGAEGHAFCPAAFSNGRRCKENFEQQQLIALDFDNDKQKNMVTFDDRVDDGQGGQTGFGVPAYKEAVHNVVKSLDQLGQHHRRSNAQKDFPNLLLPEKLCVRACVFHTILSLKRFDLWRFAAPGRRRKRFPPFFRLALAQRLG